MSGFSLLVCDDWTDYALLDSGDGRKLERYGRFVFDRPDGQAMWSPQTPRESWDADGVFASGGDEDERGSWTFPKRPLPEAWPMSWNGLRLNARCASFRHLGVFPEHSVHWSWADQQLRQRSRSAPPRVLNLFGYTGMMSLAAARAGAEVVHLDASPKAIAYGRENQALSGLDDKPIRWICDDAMKFVERELRRGRTYDAIVLDPPKYGRGPKGEVWRFDEAFPDLIEKTCRLLSPEALFLIVTVYAVRLSYIGVAQTLAQALAQRPGSLEAGEMAIRETTRGLDLPTALYARWSSAG